MSLILFIAAIIPATFYIIYIVAIDSQKPEPWPVLLLSAVVGAAVAFAVAMLGYPEALEKPQIMEAYPIAESLSIGFLRHAIPAEAVKWLVLLAFLSLNKHYDEYLDGVVYSICMAMGFAGIWSVWFMTSAIDATPYEAVEECIFIIFILVPIHLAASSTMGYFVALARRKRKLMNYMLALLVPMLINGLLCSLLFVLGNNGAYYFIAGILFSILSMIFYAQVFRLIEMDRRSDNVNSKQP